MSPDTSRFAAIHSSPSSPPFTVLYKITGADEAILQEPPAPAPSAFRASANPATEPEFGTIQAEDGQALDFALRRPTDFEPGRRYPAIVQVYGGPGRQHVRMDWRSPEERLYLDGGYVIFQLDNRGASGRGIAFEAPIAGSLGTPELADQLRGIAYLKTLPFVDPDRIGAIGWSYGGFMTMRLLTEPGSGIRAGIAGGSIARWEDYDTHYTERFLGKPQDNPEAYHTASVIPRLERLHGRLMLVHGLADDNVFVDHALAIAAELQRLGMTFDLMLYPGERHAIIGKEARRHRLLSALEFFDRELAPRHG
jgi:dipeptidyl-peptidase-4